MSLRRAQGNFSNDTVLAQNLVNDNFRMSRQVSSPQKDPMTYYCTTADAQLAITVREPVNHFYECFNAEFSFGIYFSDFG